jgi:hypothetical protein
MAELLNRHDTQYELRKIEQPEFSVTQALFYRSQLTSIQRTESLNRTSKMLQNIMLSEAFQICVECLGQIYSRI